MSENRATERLKYCDMEERSLLKRSRTQEEAEEDTGSPATKRWAVQPGPSSDPQVNPGVVGFPSSSCTSGEGSVNNKFDVFISHRGPDTKSTLAYHLYDLLRDRGVEAFLDKEELQSGETFPEAIEEAIASSKVDVCILSSGFAESVWCLKELVMMLHKFEMGKSTLVPIFYDVKPAEVKYVKGAFGQGFENLQSKDKNSTEDIEQWRRALGKIGEISGYEGKGELCKIIVNKICELLQQLHVGSVATSQKMLGREEQLLSILCDIMECRENGLGVTSVEISGIGGIGKTTFAKELYNKIYHEFERSCFIEDVNGLVEKCSINKVHKHLLHKLFGQNSSSFRMEGREHLMKKLHNAQILVVLDNIHSKIPLSKVFIEDDVSLSRRSVIIVTSREKGVLKHDPGVKGYCQNLISVEIEKLDFATSMQIFCHHAFGRIGNVKNEFNELMKKMVEKCDGLPLALTVLGRHVYNKEIKFWDNLFNFMKDSLHNEVKDKLKFSYENLGTEMEKCLFLDVATFFRGEKEGLLIQIRQRNDKDCESVQYALDMLKMNLLINVDIDGVLCMHDVLVDLGRNIVKDENLCPGHRSRVWYPSDVQYMLSHETGTDKVKALSLVWGGLPVLDEDQNPWSADVFSKLSSLEVLILHGQCIEGDDFSWLSKKLLWLKWTDFPWHMIPHTLCLKLMRVLHISGKKLKHLWVHPLKEAPSKLRKLILAHCIKLQRLPEWMGQFRLLSSIDLYNCKSLKFIPESFGQLQKLKDLRLWECQALEQLPESIGQLLQLSSICLVECTSLKFIPESFGQLQGLKDLRLSGCHALERLPESFGKLLQLENVYIASCNGLKSLPESLECLTNLHRLDVLECPKIKFSPQQFQAVQRRLQLSLSMPESDDQIGNVEDFWRNYSQWQRHMTQQDRRLVREFVEAKQIKTTDPASNNNNRGASHLSDFEAIGIHLIESAALLGFHRRLCLHGFWNLRELPQCLGNLQELCLHRCYSLEKLPDSVGQMFCLKRLVLEWCWNLQELPDTIGHLLNLEELIVTGCLAFKGFPSSLRNLSRLRRINVEHCCMMEVIHTKGLFNLRSLDVYACVNLKSIVGLSDLWKLERLIIEECMNLRHMPLPEGGFATFKFLWNLSVSNLGCYQLCFTERLPHEYQPWNNNDLVENGHYDRRLTARTSPLFFGTLKERVRHMLSTSGNQDKPSFFFHELSRHTHVPSLSLPFSLHARVVCFDSSVYTDDFADQFPLPVTHFYLSQNGTFIHHPSYEAHVKEGFIVFLGGGEEEQSKLLVSKIHNIFLSELKRQRLLSGAWTQLPSQLQIHEFSALDIAGCQITKISRHGDTCIMEEETSLTCNRRRCIFTDDHALLLQQSKISKHSFLAYPGVDHDLETAVANLYEMSISVLVKGKAVYSRKLHQICPKTSAEIPSPLNTLLQQRAFHFTSETMHRMTSLCMQNTLKSKYLGFNNYGDGDKVPNFVWRVRRATTQE